MHGKNFFSREVNKALGLSQKQLAIVSATAGAAIGGIIDASMGGASFLTGTVIGGGVGAATGYFSHTSLIHVTKSNPLINKALTSTREKIKKQRELARQL